MNIRFATEEISISADAIFLLPLNLHKHFLELELDDLLVRLTSTAVQTDEGSFGFLKSPLLCEPSGREGQEEHAEKGSRKVCEKSSARWLAFA